MSSIDSVDLWSAVLGFLIGLVPAVVLALIFTWRNRSDNRAARPIRAERLPALPRNFDSGWDRLDEMGRPW